MPSRLTLERNKANNYVVSEVDILEDLSSLIRNGRRNGLKGLMIGFCVCFSFTWGDVES